MALKEPFMLKQHWGTGDLELVADAGESLLIKDVRVYNPATNYATFTIEKATVGFFRVGGTLGNHLALMPGNITHAHNWRVSATSIGTPVYQYLVNAYGVTDDTFGMVTDAAGAATCANATQFGSVSPTGHKSILKLLGELGIFAGYPVAEGQKFTISGVGQAGALQLVEYEIHDAGDKLPTHENGSEATEYFFINYGRPRANITTTTETIYDIPQSPPEFPDFPFGKDVPAKYEIDILGVLASDIVDDRGGGDSMNSTYLKFVKERVIFHDEDKNGIFLRGITGIPDTSAQIGRGVGLIGNFSDTDGKFPLFFPQPMKFVAGEELGVYLATVAGPAQAASDLLVADVEIGLIEKVRKVV